MAPPRPQTVPEPPLPMPPLIDNVPYTLALLGEYTHTLDSLPIDLSRNFADLRELDAVLSSSVLSITAKIQNLTAMIEEGRATKQERLWLLTDIAEEAQRLKLGGEDKIRVACQGADTLRSHTTHMRALAMHIPGFDSAPLDRTTVYPHVSERAYMPPVAEQTGRRRRGVLGSIMTNPDPNPSPAKRKRVPKDDDVDVGPSRTPKRASGESTARPRNNARAKKTERATSPSESLVSVTSHLPPPVARNNSSSSRAGGSGNKRSRAGAASSHRNPTPLANEAFPANDGHQAGHGHTANGHSISSRNRGAAAAAAAAAASAADYGGIPPSASHPSLPQPYGNGAGVSGPGYDGVHAGDWGSIPRASQLEGPGMPVARSASVHSTATSLPTAASVAAAAAAGAMDTTDGGEGDGDGDDRTYCFCDNVSYGQMVGCDGPTCEREWFHLACVGLTVVPDGNWFCDPCKNRKATKRTVRGAKRRTGVGSRAAGR